MGIIFAFIYHRGRNNVAKISPGRRLHHQCLKFAVWLVLSDHWLWAHRGQGFLGHASASITLDISLLSRSLERFTGVTFKSFTCGGTGLKKMSTPHRYALCTPSSCLRPESPVLPDWCEFDTWGYFWNVRSEYRKYSKFHWLENYKCFKNSGGSLFSVSRWVDLTRMLAWVYSQVGSQFGTPTLNPLRVSGLPLWPCTLRSPTITCALPLRWLQQW